MTDIAKLESDFKLADKQLKAAQDLHTAAQKKAAEASAAVIEAAARQRAALLALDETRVNGFVESYRGQSMRGPRIVTIRGKTAYARKPGDQGNVTTYSFDPEKPNGPWSGVSRPTAKDSYAGAGHLYMEETK